MKTKAWRRGLDRKIVHGEEIETGGSRDSGGSRLPTGGGRKMRQIAFRILTTDGHRWTQILQEATEITERSNERSGRGRKHLTQERRAESRSQDLNH